MADLSGFNANDVEPNAPFEPLPAGKYLAAVTASRMKPTKQGDGSYLELELSVLEGPYRDRKVWDRLCLEHPNAQTVKFARSTLSSICRAVGVLQPRDSVELHNLPLVVTVRVKKREDTGDLANEVRGYAAKQAAAGRPQQAPVDDDTPPWRR